MIEGPWEVQEMTAFQHEAHQSAKAEPSLP